ncbi:MAG: hypothetical protein I3270_02595 [Candidatus Moeniiplasma glomeromycotorum]|nr:hypothetical protein [Candidatus Moeniiplasma glomeromycotorum]MCE8162564.1 hypothetical protein [Candidatus Moeniiplasma glomeromycotorum]MCE8166512.1 hypothetical protein [Candidatus Moeniiplasma glomeromycotorum]MCE8166947.1 hypothetical protein [Candidatus Moeniiplasma glomeromycotorum]
MINQKEESSNTLKEWATGKLAMFAVGLAAGYALYHFGVIQKLTDKIFSKKTD